MIDLKYIPDRISDENLRELMFIIIKEIQSYLEIKEAFWMDDIKNDGFRSNIEKLNGL